MSDKTDTRKRAYEMQREISRAMTEALSITLVSEMRKMGDAEKATDALLDMFDAIHTHHGALCLGGGKETQYVPLSLTVEYGSPMNEKEINEQIKNTGLTNSIVEDGELVGEEVRIENGRVIPT